MKKLAATALAIPLLASSAQAAPSLTIYNQNSGVVRETIPLDLKAGTNNVVFPGVAATLEPDSVILRDATGKRKLSIIDSDSYHGSMHEGYAIHLRNRTNAPVTIRVIEHLERGANWKVSAPSDAYTALDSRTIEFRVAVPAGGEKTVTYTARYTA